MFSFDQVQLTLDRTNWKWGKRDINILMLAIVYRGIAIPIVWTLLNKRGNSDTKERIALIQRFIAIFGKDRIVIVFADREFIGEQWFTWLIEQDINFCIRVKKTSLSPIIYERIKKLVIYFAILKLVKLNVVNDGFWLVG